MRDVCSPLESTDADAAAAQGPSLLDDIVAFMGRGAAIEALAQELDSTSPESLRIGAVLSVPVVLANIAEWVVQPAAVGWLEARLSSARPDEAGSYADLACSGELDGAGERLLSMALGRGRGDAAEALAARAGLDAASASRILAATARSAMTVLAKRHRSPIDRDELICSLRSERAELEAAGWGQWIEAATGGDRGGEWIVADAETGATTGLPDGDRQVSTEVDDTDDLAGGDNEVWPEVAGLGDLSGGDDVVAPEVDDTDDLSGGDDVVWPEVDVTDDLWADDEEVSAVVDGDTGWPIGDGASPEVAGSELPATEVTDHRPTAAGDGLAESAAGLVGEVEPDLVLGGSEWVAVADPAGAADVGGSGETGSRPSSGDLAPGASGYSSGRPPAPTRRRWPWLAALLALLAAVAAAAAYAGYTYLGLGGDEDALGVSAATTSTVGSTTTSALFEVADAAALLIVVELGDPLGASTATGQAELSFDVGQGEICYAFAVDGVGSPYGAYLHAGRAGTEGGIVVDFGLMEGSPEVACVPVARVDVEAILADRAGYYVEIHDPDGVTIRSQLGPGGNESEVDPKGGGALVVIEAGTLTLIGDVPDEQAAADLRASFADIDLATTEIVDQLRVVEGAPPPSGRILVDETILFDFDSARMLDPDNTVLQDLATIFDARPGWAITIVGHTDSSGPAAYNLELSLRRADAVRDALVAAGVDEESLSIEGAGDTEPIADNDTAEGRARNRRIELEVTPA